MKKRKWGRILCISMTAALMAALAAGCGQADDTSNSLASSAKDSVASSAVVSESTKPVSVTDKPVGFQLDAPAKGEEIAVITTNKGVMKMRLFADEAPKAVENFKKLAEQGFYNGVIFHRVIQNFMAQTGQGNGQSIYGASFEDEFTANLLNLRGSVSMANAGPNTNGTQFFINQAPASAFPGWTYYQTLYDAYQQNPQQFSPSSVIDMSKVTQDIKELYSQNGGNPHLDGSYNMAGRGHTVFGQVFEGLDVLDAITASETDVNDRPVTDITIESITLEPYEG
jgi:cyclophilin family peptidyl-prolyl cis-trans isomerase